jgi:gliding motility-associated-like protein
MPTVVAGSDVFVLLNNSVVLNPTITNATKIEWTPANYLNYYSIDKVTCTPLKDIIYKIKTTSKDGCVDSAFQKVLVDKSLNIPNVFTPNGDNVNETWTIDGLRVYPRNIMQIFNRYGQNIFTSSPGNYKPWNGKLNGNDLPVGTYYYILKLTTDASPIAGSITILR